MGTEASTCRASKSCEECAASLANNCEIKEWQASDGHTPMQVAGAEALEGDRIDAWAVRNGDLYAPTSYIADVYEGAEIVMKDSIAELRPSPGERRVGKTAKPGGCSPSDNTTPRSVG
mmetsp:Transcript_48278/g.121597  ORF Transcript_48278/g.121597 Transcript_48278/m.121597 type:complete len:118 (-) Transcript_48278:75-428(-)